MSPLPLGFVLPSFRGVQGRMIVAISFRLSWFETTLMARTNVPQVTRRFTGKAGWMSLFAVLIRINSPIARFCRDHARDS
jgi:hypothetical protein